MTEEAKPVTRKVVVKKVIKKAEGVAPEPNLKKALVKPVEKSVAKPLAKPEQIPIAKPVASTSVKPIVKQVVKPVAKSIVESKEKPATKPPMEGVSTKLVTMPNEELSLDSVIKPTKRLATNQNNKSKAKSKKNSSKFPLILIIAGVIAVIGGAGFIFSKTNASSSKMSGGDVGGGVDSGSVSGIPFFNNILPTSLASLTLPIEKPLPAGAPLWVHLVNSAGDAEALKNGPVKALNAYKELKAASPFVILSPIPPKEGWLKPGKIKELAAEIQKTIKNQKCDPTRLVISGEGVGTTAALLLAGELNGAVGAVLGIGAPSEEAFSEVERFRYVPLRFLAHASDKDAVGWSQKIAGDLRAMGCAVSVTEISPSPSLIGGAWGAPEIWAWMATRRVADANTRAGIDSLLAWSAPKRPAGVSLTAKPAVVDETQIVKGSLLGEYFDGVAFNTKILDRMDKSINIPDRAYQLPDNKADNVSVRWTGLIKIDKEGIYTFFSSSDDGQRVSVGGVAVVDDWADHGATEKSGTIKLAVGWYTLVVEHYQGGGGGSITAWWSGPGFEKKLIEGDVIATLKPKQGKQ